MKKNYLLLTLISLTIGHASSLDLGVGLGTFSYPDYVGASQENSLIFPYPYVSYKSDTLEVDNKGIQKELFKVNNVSLHLSLSGSLPAKSTGIREGMPKLDPSGEIGPAIFYHVYHKNNNIVDLEFPLRAVLSTNFKNINYQGYIYEAKFRASYETENGYLLKIGTGPVWADREYHNYLYGVKEEMATEQRFYYNAKAGYMGYKTSLLFSKTFNNILLSGFIRHYSLIDSSIENSPLLVKDSAFYGGFSFVYMFDKTISTPIKEWFEK